MITLPPPSGGDDTQVIRNHLALAAGGVLSVPRGHYKVSGYGGYIFLLDASVSIIGEGAGNDGTVFSVCAPDDTDVFRISPAGASAPFTTFRSFRVEPAPGSVGGRDVLAIVTNAASQIQRFVAEDLWLHAGAGYAISGKDTDVSYSTACYYQSVIQRNVLYGQAGSIHFTQAGDSITIADNAIPPIGDVGIYIEPVTGAAMQVIERNGFQGNAGGAIILKNCNQAKIRDNQIEQGVPYTGSGGVVRLDGCEGCEVTGNNINAFGYTHPVRIAGNSRRNRITANTLAVDNATQFHAFITTDALEFNVIDDSNRFLTSYGAGLGRFIVQSQKAQGGILTPLYLYNGWVGSGADHDGLFYLVHDDGTITLHGNIRNGTNISGTAVAALPPECAPKKKCYVPVWCTGNTIGLLCINTDGTITIPGTVLPQTSAVKVCGARFPSY